MWRIYPAYRRICVELLLWIITHSVFYCNLVMGFHAFHFLQGNHVMNRYVCLTHEVGTSICLELWWKGNFYLYLLISFWKSSYHFWSTFRSREMWGVISTTDFTCLSGFKNMGFLHLGGQNRMELLVNRSIY